MLSVIYWVDIKIQYLYLSHIIKIQLSFSGDFYYTLVSKSSKNMSPTL